MKHILVVDDEPMIRDLVVSILCATDITVVAVDGVCAAKFELDRTHFDLLLCDVNLRGELGTSLLEYEKVIEAQTAVIVMSGAAGLPTAMDVIRRGAFALGQSPSLQKSFARVSGRPLPAAKRCAVRKPGRGSLNCWFMRERWILRSPCRRPSMRTT